MEIKNIFENNVTNMRPTATNIAANVPAFLSKLWKMVNDPDTDHLITWSPVRCYSFMSYTIKRSM